MLKFTKDDFKIEYDDTIYCGDAARLANEKLKEYMDSKCEKIESYLDAATNMLKDIIVEIEKIETMNEKYDKK